MSQAGGIEEGLGPAPSLGRSVAAPPGTPDVPSNTGLGVLSKGLGSQPKSSRKACEVFSLRDLDQLLHTVIVNLYMCSHAKLGEHWKEVARHMQDNGSCPNHEWDTLKNKVASLLAWVEGQKKKTPRSALGKEWEHDPALFTSLSGKLDAMQHLNFEEKGPRRSRRSAKNILRSGKGCGRIYARRHGDVPVTYAEARMLPISISWHFREGE
ncbi:hypothetical protein JB92DRAFT_2836828 [Gautieria morchelliformis]|nr:hypothetical protein JB92DRAFT_2836828 [Gautieria morchelliformis]